MTDNKTNIYLNIQHNLSDLDELILGHIRFCIRNVPPMPNYQSEKFEFTTTIFTTLLKMPTHPKLCVSLSSDISSATLISHVYYILQSTKQLQKEIKLNRVFFPR